MTSLVSLGTVRNSGDLSLAKRDASHEATIMTQPIILRLGETPTPWGKAPQHRSMQRKQAISHVACTPWLERLSALAVGISCQWLVEP